ncbi:MAG: diguanylate cyclase, partial [Acidobacteriota bacterium]
MASKRLGLPSALLRAVFPFHLAFDRHLEIVQVGDVLKRICPGLSVGGRLDENFRISRPNTRPEFDSLRELSRSVFILESRYIPLQLKGQMLYNEGQDVMLFLCSPWVTDLATLGPLGLSLNDFAVHDPIADFLFLLQAQNTALSDRKKLARKLATQRAELRASNEELRRRNRELQNARAQAATDALTGLGNHRLFHERTQDAVRRAQEDDNSVGLVMLDIDDFKLANDSMGHQAGDNILREIALALIGTVGEEKAYRYGGDEFAVLLPAVDHRKAAVVAERLRRASEKRTRGNGNEITVSLGVASFPDVAASVQELIYGADAAMYWAKAAGKNRVGHWSKLVRSREDGSLPWCTGDRDVRAADVVGALISALAARDPVTSAHAERCSWYTARLADELGLDERERSIVRLASLLHDVGKLAVPDEVLFKPGPLNEEEWAQMKQHSTAALHVLSQIRTIADATPAILHHHEHFDGSG